MKSCRTILRQVWIRFVVVGSVTSSNGRDLHMILHDFVKLRSNLMKETLINLFSDKKQRHG